MQIESSPVTDITWASAEVLNITIRQLRLWEKEMAGVVVVEPTPDERAWDGTEIDVRRTVL